MEKNGVDILSVKLANEQTIICLRMDLCVKLENYFKIHILTKGNLKSTELSFLFVGLPFTPGRDVLRLSLHFVLISLENRGHQKCSKFEEAN
jgi:hypothetical protein